MIVADPRLKQLADNGGPTKTHAMFYSAAVDGGAQCTETTDQRYVARNQGAGGLEEGWRGVHAGRSITSMRVCTGGAA